jgi:hypothetical protein
MSKQSNFRERLISFNEQIKNPEVLKYLCNEVPDQILIKGKKMIKVLEADGDLEKIDDIGDVYALGLPLKTLNQMISAEISSPNQISKGNKISLKYLFKKAKTF